jgi:hypothetical protein
MLPGMVRPRLAAPLLALARVTTNMALALTAASARSTRVWKSCGVSKLVKPGGAAPPALVADSTATATTVAASRTTKLRRRRVMEVS